MNLVEHWCRGKGVVWQSNWMSKEAVVHADSDGITLHSDNRNMVEKENLIKKYIKTTWGDSIPVRDDSIPVRGGSIPVRMDSNRVRRDSNWMQRGSIQVWGDYIQVHGAQGCSHTAGKESPQFVLSVFVVFILFWLSSFLCIESFSRRDLFDLHL